MTENKSFYLQHLPSNLPLFHQPHWLHSVAGENWDIALVRDEDRIIASMPYAYEKKIPGLFIRGPFLTQYLGPYYDLKATEKKKISNLETEILNQLADQLPPFALFEQRWHFSYQNYAPFVARGFSQRLRSTHILTSLADPQMLLNHFSEKTRREIRKAEKSLTVVDDASSEIIFHFLRKHLSKRGYRIPWDVFFFQKLCDNCKANNCGKIFSALSEEKTIRATILVTWDSHDAYYIIGARNDDGGNDGAMSLLFWNAFQFLFGKVQRFDFLGSMIPGVAAYFKSFGAREQFFAELSRVDSKLVRIKKKITGTFRS